MERAMDAIVIWDDEPGANVDHIAEHGLTPDEVDEVLMNQRIPVGHSKSSGQPASSVTPPPGSTSSSCGKNRTLIRARFIRLRHMKSQNRLNGVAMNARTSEKKNPISGAERIALRERAKKSRKFYKDKPGR